MQLINFLVLTAIERPLIGGIGLVALILLVLYSSIRVIVLLWRSGYGVGPLTVAILIGMWTSVTIWVTIFYFFISEVSHGYPK